MRKAVTLDALKKYETELAGNWRQWDSFGWHDAPDPKRFTLVNLATRDADSIDESNKAQRLETYPILDEEHHSAIEMRDEDLTWDGWMANDFRNELEKHFPDYEDQATAGTMTAARLRLKRRTGSTVKRHLTIYSRSNRTRLSQFQ